MSEPTSQPQFDVFLSHNSKDKPAVIALAKKLQAHGIKVWLDVWELRPGHPWQEALEKIIKTTKSAAVLVGKDGIGPWEDVEMRACLDGFVKRKLPVIPVLLPDCPIEPDLPLLLQQFTWVDCRDGKEEEGFNRLMWGITGEKPAEYGVEDEKLAKGEADKNPETKSFKKWKPRLSWVNALVLAILILLVLSWLMPKKLNDSPSKQPDAKPKVTVLEAGMLASGKPDSSNTKSEAKVIEPEMVSLPGGEFWMGSDTKTDTLASDDEMPRHKVKLNPFSIGKYEVTVGEYAVFAKATDRPSSGCWGYNLEGNWAKDVAKSWRNPGFQQTDQHPVVCVSHQDAKAYADWLKVNTGKAYRLPTEAEWEFAARAGTTTPWFWPGGESATGDYAWFWDNAGKMTHPVGQKKPNKFGLYDTAGNAWEWVEDSWHDNYQGAPTDGTAWVDGSANRVLRGGSWINYGRSVRSALRYRYGPDSRRNFIGFRLALGQTAQ